MRLRYTDHAFKHLTDQLDYLIERNAHAAAETMRTRVAGFLQNILLHHPRTGRYIPERAIWETWIPRTKLVVWYVFDDDELTIIEFWHTAQDRRPS